MSWARFDDDAPDNPKVLKAGPIAANFWWAAICYSHKHGTGGMIELHVLSKVAPSSAMESDALRDAWPSVTEVVTRLVTCGLFEMVEGGGYRIHDFEEYGPGEEEAADRKAQRKQLAAARQKKYRDKLKEDRAVTRDVTHNATPTSRVISDAVTPRACPARVPRARVPDPVPIPERDQSDPVVLLSKSGEQTLTPDTASRESVSDENPESGHGSSPRTSPPASDGSTPVGDEIPPATGQPSDNPDTAAILIALKSHNVLSSVATLRLAEAIQGRRMARGNRPLEWFVEAIGDAARDAAAEEAAQGGPILPVQLAKMVGRYADNARAPRGDGRAPSSGGDAGSAPVIPITLAERHRQNEIAIIKRSMAGLPPDSPSLESYREELAALERGDTSGPKLASTADQRRATEAILAAAAGKSPKR